MIYNCTRGASARRRARRRAIPDYVITLPHDLSFSNMERLSSIHPNLHINFSASNNGANQQPENPNEEESTRRVTRSVTRSRRTQSRESSSESHDDGQARAHAQVRAQAPAQAHSLGQSRRIWVDAGGRTLSHQPDRRLPPPFLGILLSAPIYLNPLFPPLHPHYDINQPIRMSGNRPIPRNPPRNPNAPRGPPPQSMELRVLSGSVNQIVEWFENVQGVPIYEVTGYFIGIGMVNPRDSPHPGNELNLLLRDRRNSGPILQVIQPCHLLPEMPRGIEAGRLLRCIGKVVDPRRMIAVKISFVPASEQDDYNRVRHVCRSVS